MKPCSACGGSGLIVEGGDWVDYGSAKVQLPETVAFCDCRAGVALESHKCPFCPRHPKFLEVKAGYLCEKCGRWFDRNGRVEE